jgi:DnaK suppressor protein
MAKIDERNGQLKNLLTSKKLELLADVKKSIGDKLDADIRLTFDILKDNPDKSVDELLKHVDAKIIGNKSEEIDDIDSALYKLEDGTYGVCEECGDDIPVKRLDAVPSASYCVNCQDVIDRIKKDEEPRKERGGTPEKDDYIFSETD